MKYLIANNDGTVGIMETLKDADPAKCIEKWPKEKIEKVASVTPIEDSEIPVDRYFRNAWTFVDGKIKEDMEKCREIHCDKLRAQRKHMFIDLDTAYIIAFERADEAAMKSISAKKQALRDVTEHSMILKAQTPEELRKATIEELTG